MLPKMSARSGLVGKANPGPICDHFRQFFAWAGQMQKMLEFCLFSLVGQWALFTWFLIMCWCHLQVCEGCEMMAIWVHV